MEVNYMKKDNTLNLAKETLKSTAEGAIKIAISTAKNVKRKATRVATTASIGVKNTVTKKVDVAFYVQYHGKEIGKEKIIEKVYATWVKSHKLSEIKTLEIYFKVEDDTAYCLVNGEINIDLKLS
jgi:hypothetical protein